MIFGRGGYMILLILLFYFLLIPFFTLLHEVGHGIGAVFSSNSHVHIYLGTKNKNNKENFKIGKLHFHIIWSYIGFAYWKTELNKRQSAVALVCGPLMSLLLALLFGWLTIVISQSQLHQLFWWSTIYNSLQFLITIIPIKYPRWMGGYGGYNSDGLQLLRILKGKD